MTPIAWQFGYARRVDCYVPALGKLLFLHWSRLAESLRPLIPDPLVIDTFDGAAWIGITPFTM